jgi:DNA mismatch repair protein MutL
MEVRFDDEAAVKAAVTEAVETALLDHGLIRSSAPRGRSAPEQTEVSPIRASSERTRDAGDGSGSGDGNEDEVVGGAGTKHEAASGVRTGRARTTQTPTRVRGTGSSSAGSSPSEPLSSESSSAPAAAESTGRDRDRDSSTRRGQTGRGEGSGTGSDRARRSRNVRPAHGDEQSAATSGGEDAGSTSDAGEAGSRQSSFESASGDGESESGTEGPAPGGFAAPTTQRTLSGGDAAVDATFERLPRMRVLGQLYDTYLVAETETGLLLIDQHAADERVNYERLRREVLGDTPTQALADPVELELTAREAALFEEYREALAQVGFHAGRTGERTVEVRSVPAVFDAALDPELLRDALSAFVAEETEGGRRTVDAVADSLLADLACYPSITGNTSLTEGTVSELLAALDACENPYACPHGRPVIIEFGRDDIEDRFERDYPGHAGRREE